MTQAARAWSQHMASANTLTHSGSDRLTSHCGASPASGENIVYQWLNGTARSAFEWWLSSPDHRANMESIYTHTGVGFYWDKAQGKMWGTQIFIECTDDHICPTSITSSQASYPTTHADAICHSLTVPDSVRASQSFSATINWENTGNAPWFDTYRLVATNEHWGQSQSTFFGTTTDGYHINPGIPGSLKSTFTAPASPGNYEFYWRPRNASGTAFGATCGKVISVTGGQAAKTSPTKATTPTTATPTTSAGNTTESPASAEEPANQEDPKKQNTKTPQAQTTAPQNNDKAEESWHAQLSNYVTGMSTATRIGISVVVFLIVSGITAFEVRLHISSLMNLARKLKGSKK